MTDKEIDELFNQGIELSASNDPDRAIAIFENLLRDQPALNRVRLELALANFRALNYAEARRQAQQVLNDPAIPDKVVASVKHFLEKVNKQDRRHVWTPSISVGLMYDDNVNASAVSAGVIDVGGTSVTLVGNTGALSDTVLQVNAGLSHRYLSANTMKLKGQNVAFFWKSKLSLFRNHYSNEDDFHLNVITARTGPAWLAARHWWFQIPVQVDHIMFGDDTIAWFTGVSPSLSYFFGRISLTANGQIQKRDYRRSIDDARDSTYTSGGLSLGYRSPGGKVSARIGMQYFDENAHFDPVSDSDRRSNAGTQFTGSFNFRPWPKVNTFVRISLRSRDHNGVEPIFDVARDEFEKRYIIGANYTFSDGYLDDWQVRALVRSTDNDSNIVLFDYERKQYLFTVSRAF